MNIHALGTTRADLRRQARAVQRRHVTARARRREHGAAEPTAAKLEYMRRLGRLLKDVWAELVRAQDLPRQDAVQEMSLSVTTGQVEKWDARADKLHVQVLEKVQRDAPSLIGEIGRRVSGHNGRQHQRLLGINLRLDPGTAPIIDAFREENVRLITNLTKDMFARVGEIVADFLGGRVEDLSAELQAGLDFTKVRANLIARDQTLKLNGQLTRVRQQNAGIDEYVWTTSNDERVREEHAALEGTTQRWDTPPTVGHPGDDIQCRCVAYPVIPGLDESVPEGGEGEQVTGVDLD